MTRTLEEIRDSSEYKEFIKETEEYIESNSFKSYEARRDKGIGNDHPSRTIEEIKCSWEKGFEILNKHEDDYFNSKRRRENETSR